MRGRPDRAAPLARPRRPRGPRLRPGRAGPGRRVAPLVHDEAARFFPDWKPDDAELVRERFPAPAPQRELRVRTAIDSKSRRAKDEDLFSYRLIHPEGLVGAGWSASTPNPAPASPSMTNSAGP